MVARLLNTGKKLKTIKFRLICQTSMLSDVSKNNLIYAFVCRAICPAHIFVLFYFIVG